MLVENLAVQDDMYMYVHVMAGRGHEKAPASFVDACEIFQLVLLDITNFS